MTVIAWRNGTMCCDSCWSSNGLQNGSAIKIRRLSSGALLGQAGDNDCRGIDQLLDKIKDPQKLPSRRDLMETRTDFEGLIAFPRGGVWHVATGKVDAQGFPDNDEADFGVWLATTMGGYAAVGSGGEVALAAMDAGASAFRAVEIACRRNIFCRPPIHSVLLHARPTRPRR